MSTDGRQFAKIDTATTGNNTLVAAVTGRKIRVTSLFLVATASVTVAFQSGAGGTALTGTMQLQADGTAKTSAILVLPHNPAGWFETAAATLLNLSLGGNVQVSGSLSYEEV